MQVKNSYLIFMSVFKYTITAGVLNTQVEINSVQAASSLIHGWIWLIRHNQQVGSQLQLAATGSYLEEGYQWVHEEGQL